MTLQIKSSWTDWSIWSGFTCYVRLNNGAVFSGTNRNIKLAKGEAIAKATMAGAV